MTTEVIIAIITAIGGALSVWITSKHNTSASNEGVYATHTDEMWARIDALTNERDDLKQKVIKLTAKVEEQSKIITDQGILIETLNTKIDVLLEKFGVSKDEI